MATSRGQTGVSGKQFWIWNAIALVLAIAVYMFVPRVDGLTDMGARTLAVFTWTVILWCATSVGYSTMGCICLSVILGLIDTDTILGLVFGSSPVVIMVTFCLATDVLMECGFLDYAVRWELSRNLLKQRPYLFLTLFAYFVMFIGSLFSQIITVFVFCGAAKEFCEMMGYKRGEKFHTSMMCIVLWVACIGESILPFKGLGIIVTNAIRNIGINFDFVNHCKIAIPFALLYPVLMLIVVKFFIRPDVSLYNEFDAEGMRRQIKEVRITLKMKIVMISYILMLLIWVFPYMPFCPESIASVLLSWGSVFPSLVLCVVYAYIRIDGKPLLDLEQDWSKVRWNAAIFAGGILVFSALFANPEGGVSSWMSNLISHTPAGRLSFVPLVVLAVYVTMLLTQFTSNGVVATTIGMAFYSVLALQRTDFGTSFFTIMLLSCGTAFLTQAASPIIPCALGSTGFVDNKDALKPGIVMLVLAGVLVSVCGIALG